MTARVALVLVGDELLAGRHADGNGVWLADRLHALGRRVVGIHTVGDDETAIAEAVRAAAARADLVVVGGGLGPTPDDRTRAGVARAAGVALVHDPAAWAAIEAHLARRGRPPTAAARRQAEVPTGGSWLPNPVGTAPGLALAVDGTRVLVLPGVPREWRALCEDHVLAGLAPRTDVAEQVLFTAGIPESELMARLEGLAPLEGVALASYPHDGEVELRVRAEGADAATRTAAAHAAVRACLGPAAYEPPAGGALEHVVVAALRARGGRLATAESITGGLLARMLTAVPGASAVFPVGWVVYETAQKTACLGVPAGLIAEHGVVSAPVAEAMAEGARTRAPADHALATTGTAGPDPLEQPGHAPVPPGRVFVALASAGAPTRSLALDLPFGRLLTQRHAAVRALDLLRRALDEGAEFGSGR